MKTQIFTFVFNIPDLLVKQIGCLKKFLIGDYDINVVCDYREDTYIFEFLSENSEWRVKIHYKNNNGLTVLERMH